MRRLKKLLSMFLACLLVFTLLPVNADAGKDSKLTFFVSYVSSDGSYSGYTTFTYYDIGYTSNELLDNYVASL